MRFLVGWLVFAAIFGFGWFVLGIHPSVAEDLLLVVAISSSLGVSEGMK